MNKIITRVIASAPLALPLAFIAACGSQVAPITRIAEPIGPAPSAPSSLDEGRLVVHTDIGREPIMAGTRYLSVTRPVRQSYTVFDLDGNPARTIAAEDADSRPGAVNLQAGDYLVRATGLSGRLVELKVHILPGRMTEVFLDRSWAPPEPAMGAEVVRASDRTAVGRLAAAICG